MKKEIVKMWDDNKESLRSHIKITPQKEYSDYENLLKLIVEVVLYDMDFDISKMVVIDNGDYQGTQIFIIPKNGDQPDISEHYYTHNQYGSCSGCDWIQSISNYEDEVPSEKQVNEYMELSLHLIQRFKPFIDFE